MSSSASEAAIAWTTLAHLLRPQGRKGELLAELLTDFPSRFADQPAVFLAPEGFAGAPEAARPATVTNHWLPVGRNGGRIVLTFAGVTSISEAEALAGLDVLVPQASRIELEPDVDYISDLMGCLVFDGVTSIGEVTGVDFPTTPDGGRRLPDAAPLLTVATLEGEEILIPYVREFLISVSTAGKRIEMKLPEGLLDLNRPSS